MIGDLGFDLTEDALGEKGRAEALAGVARCVLSQIERPYPCSERQTLTGPDDLELPRLRFPAFFGSFDWHSCVHSHWTLVRMLATDALAGNAELEAAAAAQLARTFSPDLMEAEAASWRDRVPTWEKKPYGWTWELALDVELARLAATPEGAHAADAAAWREAARPLTEEMRRRTMGWIASLSLPSRTGIHSDTGWNLAMAIDCGRAAGDDELTEAAAAAGRRLFLADECAPCAYEPQADTFTSSVLNEAALMARVLGANEYTEWLEAYLPQLFRAHFSTPLIADLPGRWNGEGYLEVHTVALPTSRALAARDAAGGASGRTRPGRLSREARALARRGRAGRAALRLPGRPLGWQLRLRRPPGRVAPQIGDMDSLLRKPTWVFPHGYPGRN